jgi:ATP-dependent DNA helicase RecQ
MGPRPVARIDEATWDEITALRREHAKPLGHPRAVARLLCGISTPWLTKAKLTRGGPFGLLAEAPFAEVLAEAERRYGAVEAGPSS